MRKNGKQRSLNALLLQYSEPSKLHLKGVEEDEDEEALETLTDDQ